SARPTAPTPPAREPRAVRRGTGGGTALQEATREAAVEGNDGAGDVGGAIRAEERDEIADLTRRAEAPDGNRGELGLGHSFGRDLAYALRVDPAGRDRVDRDPERPELTCERLGPADDAGPNGVREREVVDGLAHGARTDVDDPAPAAAL